MPPNLAALCTPGSGRERVRIVTLCARARGQDPILLHGYSRFANIAASLAGHTRRDGGIAWHEHGIDGWEVSIHRSLSEERKRRPPRRRPAPAAPAVATAARDFVIDLPRKKDAAAIARCFLEVYGHHYVHSEVFSTRRYWDKVENGELIPAVARDEEGEVIGHVALEREPGMRVAERGEAVVRSAFRGHGLLERMTERLSQEAPKHDLQGIYAEPLTIHTFSQRNDERAGMPVCAVLLGANPEDFRPKGVPCPTAGQRQSYLRTFRFVRPPGARSIHAPAPYRDMLLKLYASLGVTVSVAAPAAAPAADSHTGIRVNDRGYGVISFDRIGPNAAIELAQALRDVRALGAGSVQLSAPIGDPGLPLLTEAGARPRLFLLRPGAGLRRRRGHLPAAIAERAARHRKTSAFQRPGERTRGVHRARPRRRGTGDVTGAANARASGLSFKHDVEPNGPLARLTLGM